MMAKYFPKSETVNTPEKPPRRCFDIEYRRRHGCRDQVDIVLIATSVFLSGFALGIIFGAA